jgi:hypothetical protein
MFEYVSLYCYDQMVSKRDDLLERNIIAAEHRFELSEVSGAPTIDAPEFR